MVIDLKVLVMSANCESRACYVGKPCESFFEFAKDFCSRKFRKNWILWIIIRTGEWYRTCTFPFIGSRQASEGQASPQPNTMVLHPCTCRCYCLTLVSEVSRNKLQMQQPSFGFARAKHQGPWCLLFLWCAPCWWLGSADRGIFAKVLWKFCEGVGESQSACWREWPGKPCKKIA